ncbi:tRNA lysidine(34) synthetase TilS [Hyunsoonleella pacifica]|uniref:tRNA(Ile)-lysidine synthase n=1 Tax=Hyunsoonleella pacifica TaxID=1080224 RepID=A0A4Q9FPQ2_9FLAO|nr:tRNA lysidine(34) synthetase TilS [Hyunsoonleella pacifica]TBN17455.1 tRNA lysidine(34) synthetase TilS [Hyunsoonleella pacifica]GGD11831.1 tRNA(Ile)-lysidine synthase [Hyunsoonleella pacifica]
MLENFKKHIESNISFLKESKLLIAISGGIDSVVLTHLCYKAGLNISLAHCNFNLRGAESDADEDFVVELAENLEVEVFTQRFDTEKYAQDNKRSIQMAARELRYNWFTELADQLKFDYILTAHHADDNLETFLINFTRGTGLEGLTGIPEINGKFVRPLLPFSSDAIESYAKAHSINWRDDSSNASVKYLRNKLRHQVVPILKEINPSLLQSFQTTLDNLNDTADIVEESTNAVLKRAIETMNEHFITFKISEFKKVNNPKAYMFEVFKSFGFTQWNDLVDLLDAETGKQVFSNTHRLIKNRDQLLLSPFKAAETPNTISVLEDETQKETPFGTLYFEAVNTISKTQQNVIYVDKDTLKYPLVLRKKKEGDIFYPLGMKGKKKLSKYFKDEKLSLLDKENTWLLCTDNDAIVWVVGRRADERFKITKNTKHILKIELS